MAAENLNASNDERGRKAAPAEGRFQLTPEDDLKDVEAWLNALDSLIALLAAQLPAAARTRFAAALHELEATAPEL